MADLQAQDTGVVLAGILDTTGFSWAQIIFEVTVDLLNDKNNGFFDEELSSLGPISYKLLDGACDGLTALSAYWSVRSEVNAIVGARCTGASTSLGWMGNVDNMAQVSMSSTSTKLSDKSDFPNLSRLVSPDDHRGQVGALIQTMALFDWQTTMIINTDTSYAKDLTTSFLANWDGEAPYVATIKLNSDGTVSEKSMNSALSEAPQPHNDPENNSKVVLLLGHDQHAFPIMDKARSYFGETIFVGPAAWVGRTPSDEDNLRFAKNHGCLGVVPDFEKPSYVRTGAPTPDDTFAGTVSSTVSSTVPDTTDSGWNAYQKFILLGGDRLTPILTPNRHLPDYAAAYTVDSIIAMTMALALTPVDLRRDGARITQELRSLEFDGVSGFVGFTDEGDRRNPKFSILNCQNIDKNGGMEWVNVGSTGVNPDSAKFALGGIQKVCFTREKCGLDSAPEELPTLPLEALVIWVPILIVLLVTLFGVTFCLYRRKKNQAAREQKAKIAAQEAQLDAFRKSLVDMCAAEQQYVPKITAEGRDSNAMSQVKSAHWCWRETPGKMDNWDDKFVEGNRADCWVKYNDASNQILELAFQEQGKTGKCVPTPGYTVDFRKMIQKKDKTNFEREIQRVQVATQGQALDLAKIFVALGIPPKIAKEPQLVLVPGDIVQISNKRQDGWVYGSKLHMEDEPLGRRLVNLTYTKQDGRKNGKRGDDDEYLVSYNNGWFPTNVTRTPNTDDLNTLRKTLGSGDDLSAPKHWDKIVNPSIAQKSKPLDKKSKEYQDVAKSFLSTLNPNIKIIRIQRIQNLALLQSYVVKRKTIIERDETFRGSSLGGATVMKSALARFERSWLWHGTDEISCEKIIQQGFNRSFCGKNATKYGKGVYFARDASYSACGTYTPQNAAKEKFVLACNVIVGEFCVGIEGARTPDLRDAKKNILYDSTVNNLHNPMLYVTYHDAQALPEYLIVFKEKKRK